MTESKNFIANYELNDYKYSAFWAGREYEHQSEVILFRELFAKYLPDLSEKNIIDIGGAYGRLAFLYAPHAKRTILADYSTHELQDGQKNLSHVDYGKNVEFLAMNAYKMPISEGVVDSLLSVRVMHHLKETTLFFSEVARVLRPGGIAIIEFANRDHIISKIRRFLQGIKLDDSGITEVSHKSSSQGLATGQISLMYNFSPDFVKKKAIACGLEVKGTYTCSFLRASIIKKIIPLTPLLKVEQLLQNVFRSTYLTPSIVIVLQKPSSSEPENQSDFHCCPICLSTLKENAKHLVCAQNHQFPQTVSGIIDLRDPRPEDVTF